MKPIIRSILDTDLYKLSMMNAIVNKFPNLKVRYKFYDRNNMTYPKGFADLLLKEVKNMEKLSMTLEEKKFMNEKCGDYLSPAFIDLLYGFRYDSSEVNITQDDEGHLHIDIEGYWYKTINWEVALMATICELYYITTGQIIDFNKNDTNDMIKLKTMIENNAFFSEFGTRRRFSFDNQDRIVRLFSSIKNNVFVGTSNVYLSMKYGLTPKGSVAHEWIMVHGALFGYKQANRLSMDNWISVYNTKNGTMLPDTYTMNVFLKSFDYRYSRDFDSIRHDSGDPYEFVDKVVRHYNSVGIDPMSKAIIFSNALDIKTAISIKKYCIGKIKSSFGIGTHLSNDVGVKPLNIVIKISEVLIDGEWFDCVKLSDDNGKHTGNLSEVELCKKTLKII